MMIEDEGGSIMRLLRYLYSFSRATSIDIDLSSNQASPQPVIPEPASSMHGPPLLVIRRCMLKPAF
jgi:hypothetical protein